MQSGSLFCALSFSLPIQTLMSVRWGHTAVKWARSVTTSLAATAVTVRQATSMTPSTKSAPVRTAVSGLWYYDKQIGGLVVQTVFETRAALEAKTILLAQSNFHVESQKNSFCTKCDVRFHWQDKGWHFQLVFFKKILQIVLTEVEKLVYW